MNTAANVLHESKNPYMSNPSFYSPQQYSNRVEDYQTKNSSDQPNSLRLLAVAGNSSNSPFTGGVYSNYHQYHNSINYEQTYDPKDKRYNKNYDYLGFNISTWQLNEDQKVRKDLELSKHESRKDIFNGAIDYSLGSSICPLRNFQNNDNL